jgi:hypothetical protein
MGWVRNVVLITVNAYLDLGNPRGVGILGRRVHGPGEGTGELVYEQPGNEVDGSCHKKRVPSKYIEREARGAKGSKKENMPCK